MLVVTFQGGYAKHVAISRRFNRRGRYLGCWLCVPYSKEMPLKAELKYFIRHLDGSPVKISDGKNAVDVLDILVKASKSLVEGVSIE